MSRLRRSHRDGEVPESQWLFFLSRGRRRKQLPGPRDSSRSWMQLERTCCDFWLEKWVAGGKANSPLSRKLDTRTLGSWPELKADAFSRLSHQVPLIHVFVWVSRGLLRGEKVVARHEGEWGDHWGSHSRIQARMFVSLPHCTTPRENLPLGVWTVVISTFKEKKNN